MPQSDESSNLLRSLQREARFANMPSLSSFNSTQNNTLPPNLFAGGFYLADLQRELQRNGGVNVPAHCAIGLACDDDDLMFDPSNESSSYPALCNVYCTRCQRQAIATKGMC
jgi:hypothetical protein